MGLYRNDTGAGIDIPYVRHWRWSPSNEYMYFSVYSQNLTEAINMVNNVFGNTGILNPSLLTFKLPFPCLRSLPLDTTQEFSMQLRSFLGTGKSMDQQ